MPHLRLVVYVAETEYSYILPIFDGFEKLAKETLYSLKKETFIFTFVHFRYRFSIILKENVFVYSKDGIEPSFLFYNIQRRKCNRNIF